jgi:hypothetical protein
MSTQDSGSDYVNPIERDATGLRTLRAILKYGLVCTPERLRLYPNEQTENSRKLALLQAGEPDYLHPQSRFCMTLCEEAELFEPKIRGFVPGKDGPRRFGNSATSHASLFGPWAIGFEIGASLRIGFAPTFYFSPRDVVGIRFLPSAQRPPGLGLQIINRLRELRELMIILAYIEQGICVDGEEFVNAGILSSLGLDLPFEPEVMAKIFSQPPERRRELLQLFSTDRESAVSLVGFIDMMLSLFQETDSTIDGEELAFYQQREWRLIHHMRLGASWYSLGEQPDIRNPLAKHRTTEIRYLRKSLEQGAGRKRSEGYFSSCWVLEQVDGRRLSDYISSIIVPERQHSKVLKLVRHEKLDADVFAAEDFGFVDR